MATYEITGPNGGVYQVDAPDSATQQEVMDNFLANYRQADPTSPPKRSYSLSEIPGAALSNAVPDALSMVSGAVNAVAHPVDTLNGVMETAVGAGNLALPDWMPKLRNKEGNTGESQARGLWEALKGQYGGWDEIKRSVAERPVATATDLLTLVTAGGAAASKIPLLEKLGAGVSAPGRVALATPGRVAAKGLDSLGNALYGSALSFPEDVGFAGKAAAIKAGKGEGIIASEAGVGKLQERIGTLSKDLDKVLAKAEAAGVTQDFVDLWGKLDDLKGQHDLGVHPIKLERAIDQMINEYGAVAARTGRVSYTPAELNTLKKALAAEVKYSSAPGAGTSSAEAAVNSAAAANARTALNAIDPEIPRINSELSPLLTLRGPLYSAAFKNKATTPHPFIAGGVGHAVAGTPGGIAAMLFGPKLLTKAGVALGKASQSPLTPALLGVEPLGGYYADRVGETTKQSRRTP